MAVKGCKVATKNVSDMGKELSRIAQVSSVGALADQMAEAEQSKTEVETQLLERVRPVFYCFLRYIIQMKIWRPIRFAACCHRSTLLIYHCFYFRSYL